MLDLAYLRRDRVLPDARWEPAVAHAFLGMERLTGTRVTAHDFTPPSGPCSPTAGSSPSRRAATSSSSTPSAWPDGASPRPSTAPAATPSTAASRCSRGEPFDASANNPALRYVTELGDRHP